MFAPEEIQSAIDQVADLSDWTPTNSPPHPPGIRQDSLTPEQNVALELLSRNRLARFMEHSNSLQTPADGDQHVPAYYARDALRERIHAREDYRSKVRAKPDIVGGINRLFKEAALLNWQPDGNGGYQIHKEEMVQMGNDFSFLHKQKIVEETDGHYALTARKAQASAVARRLLQFIDRGWEERIRTRKQQISTWEQEERAFHTSRATRPPMGRADREGGGTGGPG